MVENTARRLGEEKVSKLLWQFSLPSIISTLASSIYIIIDRIFIGQVVGAAAIAGMSVTMPISFIILSFGMLIGVGSTALVSMRLGERNEEEAETILGNTVTMILVISILTTLVFLFFLKKILIVFGASPAILPYAEDFIRIILWGSVSQYILICLPNTIRAEGYPQKAMYIQLINVGINIVLDFLFICLWGWGVRGAAMATVIAQTTASILVFHHFLSPNSPLHLKLINLRLRLPIVKGIIAIGGAAFTTQVAGSMINILYNQNLARYGGDDAIGAYGIMYPILAFLILPVFGINFGAQPIIGFNYGAGRYERVIETVKKAILASTVIATAGFIILEVFARQMFGIFTEDANVIAIGSHGMRIMVMLLPIAGFNLVSSCLFQAIGRARIALMLTMLKQVVILIPALIVLPRYLHLNGIWISGPISDVTAAIATIIVILPEIRSLRNKSSHGVMGTVLLTQPAKR